MKLSFLFFGLKVVAGSLVCILLLTCQPAVQISDPIERLIRQLHTPEGKVKHHFFDTKSGPIFMHSEPMRALIEQGNAIQPRLLAELNNADIRSEVALILGQIGDKNALPALIEILPTLEKLTEEEDFSTMCVLYALAQLTGRGPITGCGLDPVEYTPEFRKRWQGWYDSNKDYLYTPSLPIGSRYTWGVRVRMDIEAKLADQSNSAFRKKHPWITYEEIKRWRDDPVYEQKLKDFCFSVILNLSWNPGGYAHGFAVSWLGHIHDPRALSALHKLCTFAEDLSGCRTLIRTLEERGDPSSIPVLEKIPQPKGIVEPSASNEPARQRAIERIRLLQKYGQELKDKPFNAEQQTDFMKCLENIKASKS